MTTLLLTALILLLICTAAGLIFLVVTMSDQDEDEINMKNKKKKSGADEYEFEIKSPQAETKPEPQKLTISKKSNITPFSRSTIIVSGELKRDFEKALASMEPKPDEAKRKEEDGEQEFIDVLDLMSAKPRLESPNEERDDPYTEPDEFTIGEQILKNEET